MSFLPKKRQICVRFTVDKEGEFIMTARIEDVDYEDPDDSDEEEGSDDSDDESESSDSDEESESSDEDEDTSSS